MSRLSRLPITLFVAKPVEMSFADAMASLRAWLDHNKIQPADFRIAADARSFEITFLTAQEVLAFWRFKWLP